jgi:hypothetical protein
MKQVLELMPNMLTDLSNIPSFGISDAIALFGQDVHDVGAYNAKVGDLVLKDPLILYDSKGFSDHARLL